MANKNKGLGRGLSALLGDENENAAQLGSDVEIKEAVAMLKITDIEPNRGQPRKNFDREKLEELAGSIKEYGIIQPIIVRKTEDDIYQIVAGERRWRAARLAGLDKVPVVIRDFESERLLEIALIENLQREDLDPIEEALGYKKLMEELNYTQEQLSGRLLKSRPQIANTLRLLSLSGTVMKMLQDKTLSAGHGRALVPVTDQKLQQEAAELFSEKEYSVRQAEDYVKKLLKPEREKSGKIKLNEFAQTEEKLSSALGRKVKITKSKNSGQILIEFYSNEDLENIIDSIIH